MQARHLVPPPVRAMFQALFCRDVQLHLERGHLHLGLAGGAARPRPAARPVAADAELERMRRELAALLDEQPGARQVLRHLALFEATFQQHGLVTLDRVPLPLLRAALEQFEGLVSNWTPKGLATLRSKMAVALIQRDPEDTLAGRAAAPDLCASTLPLRLDQEPGVPGMEVRCDDAEVAAVYRAMGLAGAGA